MATTLVIFGASGDLTSRKLIPALYSLHKKGRLPKETRIVGVARTDFSHDAWRKELTATTEKFAGKEFDAATWQSFAPNIFYMPGNIDQPQDFVKLATMLDELEGKSGATRVYYLSTSPSLYRNAIANMGAAGLAMETAGIRRIVET